MQQLSGYGLLVLELAVALSGAQDSVSSSLGSALDTEAVKRGNDWSSLRGAWGKREDPEQDIDLQNVEDKRGWEALHGSWGKRSADWSNFRGSWGKRDVTEDLLQELEKRAAQWNNFRGSWGKRNWNQLRGAWGKRSSDAGDDEVASSVEVNDDVDDDVEAAPLKRAWQKLFGNAWLKRPDVRSMSPRSTNWSSLRGAWGKRGGPNNNWSNLRGTWGKRGGGDADWSNFRGSWGKRGSNSPSDWNSFRGSWGKRGGDGSDWSSFRGSWGKRDALDAPDAPIQ